MEAKSRVRNFPCLVCRQLLPWRITEQIPKSVFLLLFNLEPEPQDGVGWKYLPQAFHVMASLVLSLLFSEPKEAMSTLHRI